MAHASNELWLRRRLLLLLPGCWSCNKRPYVVRKGIDDQVVSDRARARTGLSEHVV